MRFHQYDTTYKLTQVNKALLILLIIHRLFKVITAVEKRGLSRCVFCLLWDKWDAEPCLGKPGPEQMKQLYQQTDCWCRIYHINIIYKISVQSNTQGWKGLSCLSSIPEDSLEAGCVFATGCLTRLRTSEEIPSRLAKWGEKH